MDDLDKKTMLFGLGTFGVGCLWFAIHAAFWLMVIWGLYEGITHWII